MRRAGQGLPSLPRRLGPRRSPAKSKNQALAAEWIKDFTDTTSQTGLIAKGALPNATALLDQAAKVPGNEATALAAKNSWFVPNAPKWADVERATSCSRCCGHRDRQEDGRREAAKDADTADHHDAERLSIAGGPSRAGGTTGTASTDAWRALRRRR